MRSTYERRGTWPRPSAERRYESYGLIFDGQVLRGAADRESGYFSYRIAPDGDPEEIGARLMEDIGRTGMPRKHAGVRIGVETKEYGGKRYLEIRAMGIGKAEFDEVKAGLLAVCSAEATRCESAEQAQCDLAESVRV